MKRSKLLWSLLAVVMVAMLAVCGCSKDEPKDEPKEEQKEGVVTNIENVVYIQFTDNETTITVEMVNDAWFVNGDTSLWAIQEEVQALVDTASKMQAIEEIKDVASLGEYGLENPAYTITLKNAAGDTVTLYIGDAVGEEECYVTVGDKTTVYKVGKAIIDMMQMDEAFWIAPEYDPYESMLGQEQDESGAGIPEEGNYDDGNNATGNESGAQEGNTNSEE